MSENLTTGETNIELYRELFWKANEYFDNRINDFKKQTKLNDNKSLSKFIKEDLGKEILERLFQIKQHRSNYSCTNCGTCCRLASSEYSYDELKEKAKNGDNYATQFTQTFTPYEPQEKAREMYPEFYDRVKISLKTGDEVYFYHCLKVTEDNLCSDYENRPQICRDFPDNPLVLLPPRCGFQQWREDVEVAALFNHALIEIANFSLAKIEES